MSVEAGAARRLRDGWLLLLLAEAVLLLVVLGATGELSGGFTPDTQAYFAVAASPNPWGGQRSPLYGFVASRLGGGASTTGVVAPVQALLHVAAVFILYGGARIAGIGRAAAFALATAALFSQSDLYHLRLLIPEAPANGFLLAALGLTLAATQSRRALWRLLAPIVMLAGAGYLLRPTQLPSIVILPALYLVFAWRRGDRPLVPAIALMLALVLPFVALSTHRLRAVGDFNIVSFGGYQMSGLAAFMLTPDTVARLPERVRPFAQAVLERREQAEAANEVPTIPLNSAGERSFVSATLGYFDIYARGYDNMLAYVIRPLLPPGESWVDSNKRLMEFSLATVLADPLRYPAWVGGATARLAGHAIATNVPMLIALALWLVLLVAAFVQQRDVPSEDGEAVSLLALAWFVSNGALPVLVTFPAARYIDTAAILLPAIPLMLAIALGRALRSNLAVKP